MDNIGDKSVKRPRGRPKGTLSKMPKDKARLLKMLKNIWTNDDNKVTERINAADEYATIMGWKLRKDVQETTNGNIIGISFDKAAKVMKPIEDKMIRKEEVITTPNIPIETKEVKEVKEVKIEPKVDNTINISVDIDPNAKPIDPNDL